MLPVFLESGMPPLTIQALTEYLCSLYGKTVRVRSTSGHGAQKEGDDLKGFGYGSPLFLEDDVEGELKKAVFHRRHVVCRFTPFSAGPVQYREVRLFSRADRKAANPERNECHC